MQNKEPTAPTESTDEPQEVLEQKRQEFQDKISHQPKLVSKVLSNPLKGGRNFLIGIGCMVGLLVVLGGVAAYGFVYNSPDRIVASSILNALNAKTVTFMSDFRIGETYSVALNGGSTGVSGSKLTAKITSIKNNTTSSFSVDAILDKDGSVYLSGEGIKSALGSELVQDAVNQGSYANLLQQKIAGKWLKINSDQLAPFDKKKAAIQSCIETIFKRNQDDKPIAREAAGIYAKNKFLVVNKVVGEKDGSTGYSLRIDSAKLKDFLNRVKETPLYAQFRDCDSVTFELDVEKRVNQFDTSSAKPTKLELWINNKDEITEIVTEARVGGVTEKLTVKPTFNQEVKIVAPTNVVSLKEVHGYLIDGTQAMALRKLTDAASQAQYQALIDKLRNMP